MVLNYTANASIGHAIPMKMLTGSTPDISSLLQFDWYEPVYFKTEESHFPSASNEKAGRFVGISEHVGHALTFMILAEDSQKIIHRSAVRTALDPNSRNLRASTHSDHETTSHIRSYLDDEVHDSNDQPRMMIIHPEELVGRTIDVTTDEGQTDQIHIIEAIQRHEDDTEGSTTLTKFRCTRNDDTYEEILTYNQLLEHMADDDGEGIVWKFKDIVGHQGPLNKGHKDYNGSLYNLTVLWENGETSSEPLTVIAADDPVSCAIYARENNLLDLPGWKRFKGIAKQQKNLFRVAYQAKLRQFYSAPKFKYGLRSPKTITMLSR